MTEDHPFPILDVIIENLYLSQGHRSGASCYRKGPGMIVTPSLEGTKARVAYGRGIVQNSTCSIGQKLKENGAINTSHVEGNKDSSSKQSNLNSTSNGLHDKRVCTKDYRENGMQSKLERSKSHTEHMTFDGPSVKNCCRHGVPCAPTRRSLDDAMMLQSSRNCRVQKCEELMTNFGSDNCYYGACACCGRSNSVINTSCLHKSQTGSGRQHGNGIQHCHPERGKRSDGCCLSCKKTDLVTSDSGLASMQEGMDKEQKEFMEGSFGNLQDALTCWWRYAAIAQLLPPWQPLEGQLYKYTNVMKGWQYRWFVLNPEVGRLEYFEKEEHKKLLKPSRGCLMLAGAVICPSDEDSQTFTVNAANGEVYRLKAFDAKERQHWVNRLRATAEYHINSMTTSLGRNSQFLGSNNSQTMHSYSSPSTMSNRQVEQSPSIFRSSTAGSGKSQSKSFHIVAPPAPVNSIIDSSQSTVMSSLKDCMLQLSTIQEQAIHLSLKIDAIPMSGGFINSLDKDMLLLKATSNAAVNCLHQCLSILQHQAALAPSGGLANQIQERRPESIVVTKRPSVTGMAVPLASNEDMADGKAISASVCKTQAKVNHCDDVEDADVYSDTDLGAMDEHKTIILHLLSQLKLGMDLTKVVLPTFILEKRSLLELFADCMAHPDVFLSIPEQPTPELRMLAVLEWYLTSFHAGRQGAVAKKPYNPIIGETFHCSWNVKPGMFTSVSQNQSVRVSQSECSPQSREHGTSEQMCGPMHVEQPNKTTLFYCAEQVSHHPPVFAFYFECPNKQMTMEASVWTRSKFMGMSIGVVMVGKIRLKLLKLDEEYEFSLPSAYARSILTVPWVELGDKVTLQCDKTGYTGGIIFHTKPFYGGRIHKVTAEVKNPSGEPVCHVVGEWNGVLEFEYSNGQTKSIDTAKLPIMRKCVRPLNLQGAMESRRLWQNVTECLKKGDVEQATQHKQSLEEEQRRGENHRKETRTPFPTQYFHRIDDEWKFRHHLQKDQQESFLSSSSKTIKSS